VLPSITKKGALFLAVCLIFSFFIEMVSFQAQADLTKETASSKSKFAVPIIYINPSETVTDADSKAKLENVLSLFEDHNINVTLLPAYQVLKYYPLTTQYLTSKNPGGRSLHRNMELYIPSRTR
jgi:hypothetical protein